MKSELCCSGCVSALYSGLLNYKNVTFHLKQKTKELRRETDFDGNIPSLVRWS